MDRLKFVENVPAEQVAAIFRDYFEQHMFVYDLLRGVDFVSLNNISFDEASIIYSVTLGEENKEHLLRKLQSEAASLVVYGKKYTPKIYLNGDLLCITIKNNN